MDLADIYAQAYDLWYAGKRSEAFEMFSLVPGFGKRHPGGGRAGDKVAAAQSPPFKETKTLATPTLSPALPLTVNTGLLTSRRS